MKITRSVLFSHKEFREMKKEDRVWACYLHCCLRYVNREDMNNASLRERFGIDVKNSAMVTRIINDSIKAETIKPYNPDAGSKAMRYIPCWA